jgi:chemotaxis receptor (MCP) glutamine deamidase CheD
VGAAPTGGATGRTIRVHVATGTVTVREAGAQEVTLR